MGGDFVVRPATRADAADMAILDDMAGDGLASWLWRKAVAEGEAEHPFAHGRALMMQREQPTGWLNCTIAESNGLVAGMVTSYAMPGLKLEKEPPEPLAPIFVLMDMARGSWFVDALAVYPQQRRRRIAMALLEHCRARARREDDTTELSLIVRSDNEPALSLYRSFGFTFVTRRPYVPTDDTRPMGRDYILMSAPL